jgi:orotate phosphoribosyltransferase
MTTGNSVMKAISAAKEREANIARVFILVDREEGGRATLKGYEVESLFSYRELLDD